MKTGYKKGNNNELLTLAIPDDAIIFTFNGHCRCNKAIVVDIIDIYTGEKKETAKSIHDPNFVYRIGEMAEPTSFCDNRRRQFVTGIHYFTDRIKAILY